jgi:DNA-binding response OmpR family regulator
VAPVHRAAIVLIVEDDQSLRELYQRVLTLEGYGVVAAEDGVDALRCVQQQPVDAVILDLMLPRLDGHGVKRSFDANEAMRNVPIILITGQLTPDINPDDFACVLYKPFSMEALLIAVRDCLGKAGY